MSIDFDPTRQYLLAGCNGGGQKVYLVDRATGSPVTEIYSPSDDVYAVSFAQDGNHIFFGGKDKVVYILNGTGFDGS